MEMLETILYSVYGRKRERCERIIRENRECVTISPIISVSGEKCCEQQVIFMGKTITSTMVPTEVVKCIPYLLVSTTANGFKPVSFLHFLHHFNFYLKEKCVEKNRVSSG